MKASLLLVSGLFATSGFCCHELKPENCQISKVNSVDTFKCPITSGSGNFDWHFWDIPDGWIVENDKLTIPKGKYSENQAYGCKVEVYDKNDRQTLKKSLYFSFKNGRINQIAEHDFDFDVSNLIPSYKSYSGAPKITMNKLTSIRDQRDDKVSKVFEGINGIGGGGGLQKLKSYFLGKGGLYKGDNANPYLNMLPADSEIDTIINLGSSNELRNIAVNTLRSKASCKDVKTFMNKLLQKIKIKLIAMKKQIDEITKNIPNFQSQLSILRSQLIDAQRYSVDVNGLLIQVKQLQIYINNNKFAQQKLQKQVNQANGSLNESQNLLSKYLSKRRQYESSYTNKANQISEIDTQIQQLLASIERLKKEKEQLTQDRENVRSQLIEVQKNIDFISSNIEQAKAKINELQLQIQTIIQTVRVTQINLDKIQTSIQQSQGSQMIADLQANIKQVQADLNIANSRIKSSLPIYLDLSANYQEFATIDDKAYYGCYRDIFNDNSVQFIEDVDGGPRLSQKSCISQYIKKVFGNLDTSRIRQQPGQIKIGTSNILSKKWISKYGNSFQRVSDVENNDFKCPYQGDQPLKTGKGKIKSISKYSAVVQDDKNKQFTIYLGSCTRIESVNKEIPEIGDSIYWKGCNKVGGKPADINAHHFLCTS